MQMNDGEPGPRGPASSRHENDAEGNKMTEPPRFHTEDQNGCVLDFHIHNDVAFLWVTSHDGKLVGVSLKATEFARFQDFIRANAPANGRSFVTGPALD